MTDLAVYYATASQVIPRNVVFTGAPATVALAVTDPTGTVTMYTGSPVVEDSPQDYHVNLSLFTGPTPAPAGLFTFMWTGIGGTAVNGAEVYAGTFRVFPLVTAGSGMNLWYCSMEELKSRLQINESDADISFHGDDYEIQLAIQTVTDWINSFCGRHFYQITETRTYRPDNVWDLMIDDIVTCTSVDLDYDGDGVYEVHWTENQQYQLLRYLSSYNPRDQGVARPRNQLQVLMGTGANPLGGQWLPWLWPFTNQNRVSITATWGWPSIPPNVSQAALLMAADLFKAKDAPWGIAGIGDLGVTKVQSNPWALDLLRPYMNMRKRVGV